MRTFAILLKVLLFFIVCVLLSNGGSLAGAAVSLHVVSDAPEPYPDVAGGSFSGPPVAESPDPLVAYRWPALEGSDGLEIYALPPIAMQSDSTNSFSGLDSLGGEHPNVTVTGIGSMRMDFGQENAGWLEFDSPDLDGNVEMSISEYNEPARVMNGPASPIKTRAPQKYGHTYRLELNKALYEGVRFGWIHVRSFGKPWHITGIRLVCQIKPSNYTGSFSCSDPELTRIWYAGAYTVKLNLLKNQIGAILMDRGDRISWTGDAYVAQAAAMAAFANLDFVKTNLTSTAKDANGIASYSLYWALSLLDYFNYSGDDAMLEASLTNVCGKLDEAYAHYTNPPPLTFYGWDERLGAGFANADLPEPRRAYAMLSIRAWREFAHAMQLKGRLDLRDKYQHDADEMVARLRKDPAWARPFGSHAAADAINAGFTLPAEQDALFKIGLSDRVKRLSYSPFNEYFIIQAMGVLGRSDDALSIIKDCWGGQLRYGGTTFFEIYDPSWNLALGQNDAVPNAQCGYTSLCHPWSAGVVKWLTEQTLGIRPTSPGFSSYTICPHLGRMLTKVSGQVQTRHGVIGANFDTDNGKCLFSAPPGTTGEICIPKVERTIESIRSHGSLLWDKDQFHAMAGISGGHDEADLIRLMGVQPGKYDLDIFYRGMTPPPQEPAWDYPVKQVVEDVTTQGNWGRKYGHDGYVLCNYDVVGGTPTDRRVLPEYVSAVTHAYDADFCWQTGSKDPRALAQDSANGLFRNIGCLATRDPNTSDFPTFTVDIDLKDSRPRQIALYFVDWDRKGRRLAVEMFDRQTLERMAPIKIVRDFTGGKYLVYPCNRSVRFRIDQIRGDNATLSGIFFE